VGEGVINALNAIGTPVVIIAATAIALLMGKVSNKLAFASGVIAVVSVALYVPIDLYPKARDAWADTKLKVEPNVFNAFGSDMTPTSVSIVGVRGETEVASIIVPAPKEGFFDNKKIMLERNPDGESFYAMIGDNKIGVIEDGELESKGFYRTVPNSQPKSIESSKRLYVGSTWTVSNTPLGKLELTFLKMEKGKVVVKLYSSNFGASQPEEVQISNKQFDVQSFEGKYEVTVQVREADFSVSGSEWAAFTIIIA